MGLLMRSEWRQVMKTLAAGSTLVLPLSRSLLVNLFLVAFQIRFAMERFVALGALEFFLVDMCLSVAL